MEERWWAVGRVVTLSADLKKIKLPLSIARKLRLITYSAAVFQISESIILGVELRVLVCRIRMYNSYLSLCSRQAASSLTHYLPLVSKYTAQRSDNIVCTYVQYSKQNNMAFISLKEGPILYSK